MRIPWGENEFLGYWITFDYDTDAFIVYVYRTEHSRKYPLKFYKETFKRINLNTFAGDMHHHKEFLLEHCLSKLKPGKYTYSKDNAKFSLVEVSDAIYVDCVNFDNLKYKTIKELIRVIDLWSYDLISIS